MNSEQVQQGRMISLIVAMDQQRLIGIDGEVPWRLPNDLKHFKQVTMGKTIVMGRRTWDSLGRALPGRQNWVISRKDDFQAEGARVFSSLQSALDAHEQGELMIIGGGDLYRQTLAQASRIYVTKVLAEVSAADDMACTYFPKFDATQFRVSAQENYPADERHAYPYRFLTLDRK